MTSSAFVGFMLCLLGCSQTEAPPPEPDEVVVATPSRRDVTVYFRYTGVVESVATAELRARVDGFLTEVHFEDSRRVEAGDLLFTIEKAPYEVSVGMMEAAVARAEATLKLAEATRERVRRAEESEATSELEVLEADAELARARAEVRSAEKELERARLDLSYTEVRTPISGFVDRNYVDAGNLVGRSEATLLATVVTLDPVYVEFDVSEAIALKYLSRSGEVSLADDAPPVEVSLADEQGFPHTGRIDFINNVLDRETGTVAVRAILENPTGKLYPGLFARVRVPFEVRGGAVLVEEDAVGSGLDGKYVYVVDSDNMVERRLVTLGERQDDGTIVVLTGLEGDETYIVEGLQRARPGSEVSPKPRAGGEPNESSGEQGGDDADTSGGAF